MPASVCFVLALSGWPEGLPSPITAMVSMAWLHQSDPWLSLTRFRLPARWRPHPACTHLVEDRRRERSTRMAASAGRAVAVIFIGFGMLRFFGGGGLGGLWIAFIGWFLLQAASESYRQISFKRAIEGVTVGDVMTPDCPTVSGNLDLQHFVEEELRRTGRRCFVVLESGAVAGLVTPQEVKQVERGRWPFTALHDIMRPLTRFARPHRKHRFPARWR